MAKVKFYIPDGHLEEKTLQLFKRAGFHIKISSRSYNPEINDDEIEMKRLRPQDFPFVISLGKGDVGISGSDILKEFKLNYPERADDIVELLDLGLGKTKLAVAISEDVFPGVNTIGDFKKYAKEKEAKGEKVVIASEYPKIAEDYLKKHGISAIVRKPAGKTEAWIIPPSPEADTIIDTTETGITLAANRCKVIDYILEATARVIASRKALESEKKTKIMEIVQLFKGALESEGKVNVYLDVVDPKNLNEVIKIIKKYVEKPTISELQGGGYDVFIVIDEKNLKYILPKLLEKGASKITVSDTRMILG